MNTKIFFVILALAALFLVIPASAQQKDWTNKVDEIFDSKPENKPGVLLGIFSKEKMVYTKAYDLSDELQQNGVATVQFPLGMLTKPFTAMAVMQLAEEGKLNLEASITKYLPLDEVYEPVRVKCLLNHTSGIKSLEALPAKPQELITAINNNGKKAFVANSSWAYSNVEYPLLCALIEKASGRSYADYLERYIFRKAKMTQSGVISKDNEVLMLSGYTLDDGKYVPAGTQITDLPGETGLYSSLQDLAKWNGALYKNRLLSCKYMGRIFSVDTLNNGKKVPFYGAGWVLMERGGVKYYWLGSTQNGFNQLFVHYPQKRTTIVMIYTSDEAQNLLKLAMKIQSLIPKEELVWD